MELIEINLAQKGLCAFGDKVAGKQGEANVKGVKFVLAEKYKTWSAFVDVKNAKGEKYRKETAQPEEEQAAFVYEFSAKDLREKGVLQLDLVLINEDKIRKPFTGNFSVTEAICAEGYDSGDDSPESGGGGGGNGVDGFSPIIDITEIEGGHRVTITDAEDTETFEVHNGNDYILTDADKSDIAKGVIDLLQVAEGGAY